MRDSVKYLITGVVVISILGTILYVLSLIMEFVHDHRNIFLPLMISLLVIVFSYHLGKALYPGLNDLFSNIKDKFSKDNNKTVKNRG